MSRKLIIVLGPTAVGKTDYSIELALKHSSPVISCDSRQIFKEMSIGTAVPDASQLAAVKHYFIQDRTVTEGCTAGRYAEEALALVRHLFDEGHENLVATGGSMFYIDALCHGIGPVPESDPALHAALVQKMESAGLDALAEDLRRLDPETYGKIDLKNRMRVLRALEVCLLTGRPFSSFGKESAEPRDFEIEKIGLRRDMDALTGRINRRVVKMMDEGLEKEVRSLTEFRNLTALQTVGYRELFAHLDNPESYPLDKAVRDIQTNTRHYAKKQMTWWKRDSNIRWIDL